MGAIELQIFVSLVVILGAAFVALICDFLKGNNEQLRESNIEMRVRQSEREKREEVLDKVQRHTIETLVQARVAPPPVAAAPAKPAVAEAAAPVQSQQFHQTAADRPDVRESYERTQQERSARRREGRRQQPPPAVVAPPVVAEAGQVPAWAQSIVLKKHPHSLVPEVQPVVAEVTPVVAEVQPVVAELEPVVESAPPVAGPQPLSVRPAVCPSPMVLLAVAPIQAQAPLQAALPVSTLTAGYAAALDQIETQERLSLSVAAGFVQCFQPVPDSLAVSGDYLLPHSGLVVEQPVFEIVEATAAQIVAEPVAGIVPEAQLAELDSPVVRIRVLSESDVLPMDEPLELALPMADAEPIHLLESPVSLPVAGIETVVFAEPLELVLPMAGSEPALTMGSAEPIHGAEPFEPALPVAEIETAVFFAEPLEMAVPVNEAELITVAEPLEPVLPAAEIETAVFFAEPLEMAPPANEAELITAVEPVEPALSAAEIETLISREPQELVLPVAGAEPVLAALPFDPALLAAEIESVAHADSSFEVAPEIPELIAPIAHEPRQWITPHVEIRSNVVEMPFGLVARNTELDQPVMADLVIPGGFHDASALARLLEEEAPFNGLAIVISVVDYVRLMADQGKPAAEQLMGSISRLVMSLTREQDFACRIAEDEFVLLFARETGASAKRRIQLVSERLWDFQLRSLGSVSVIFSWGASESTKEAIVHAVEHAREQMLESRRNRRALASGVGRFRRRVANS